MPPSVKFIKTTNTTNPTALNGGYALTAPHNNPLLSADADTYHGAIWTLGYDIIIPPNYYGLITPIDTNTRITFTPKILPPGYNTGPVIYALMTANNANITIVKDVTIFAQLHLFRAEKLAAEFV